VKRISERPDVKSAHIERRDTRNRSRIRQNISREENKKRDENVTSMRHASTLRVRKNESAMVLNERNYDDAVR